LKARRLKVSTGWQEAEINIFSWKFAHIK